MTVVDLYTIQILCDDIYNDNIPDSGQRRKLMAEMEENLTDLLPPGYRARIRRWDHPDPDEGNDDE